MMIVYLKARKPAEALAYWRLLVSNDGVGDVVVSFEVCLLALSVACREAQWDEAESILDFMQVGLWSGGGKHQCSPAVKIISKKHG